LLIIPTPNVITCQDDIGVCSLLKQMFEENNSDKKTNIRILTPQINNDNYDIKLKQQQKEQNSLLSLSFPFFLMAGVIVLSLVLLFYY
jgi:hypothetical protein